MSWVCGSALSAIQRGGGGKAAHLTSSAGAGLFDAFPLWPNCHDCWASYQYDKRRSDEDHGHSEVPPFSPVIASGPTGSNAHSFASRVPITHIPALAFGINCLREIWAVVGSSRLYTGVYSGRAPAPCAYTLNQRPALLNYLPAPKLPWAAKWFISSAAGSTVRGSWSIFRRGEPHPQASAGVTRRPKPGWRRAEQTRLQCKPQPSGVP